MPNQIDLYEPRKLMRVVRSNPPVRTFLRDTFFRDRKTFTTKTFDVDFVKGAREIAPFCSESIEGTVVKNTGYSTKNYEGAYIAPYTITIAHDLISRSPGEQLYSDRKPAERAVEKLAGDFARLEDMATRREEWMCAKALFTGKIPIKGKGVDRIIDFGFTNNETITDAAKKWTSPTALPLGDLGRWRGTVQEKGFVNCNVCLMAGDAAKSFINNPSVKEMLDIRDYHLANGEKLPRNCYDHNLTGNLAGKRECHIEPDWLLVYSIDKGELELYLLDVGTHSDLF